MTLGNGTSTSTSTFALASSLTMILVIAMAAPAALAHSASDAYLNLTVPRAPGTGNLVLHGQWDLALRDLDFVLKLDDDGDGRLTWGEVRRHQAAIERYAYAHLQVSDARGGTCTIKPTGQKIDEHADGAYAALFFDLACAGAPAMLTLEYDMFFAVDPSHRAILVMQSGANTATAVLSPQNAKIELAP
jgi:hypothetical protein